MSSEPQGEPVEWRGGSSALAILVTLALTLCGRAGARLLLAAQRSVFATL